jgi:hypothetical protein
MPRRTGQRRSSAPPRPDFVVDPDSRGQRRNRDGGREDSVVVLLERRIARLAATQDGLAARRQLRALGLGAKAIDHRLAIGRYATVFRGVYALGHAALPPRGWARAALLAVGDDAVLSHRSAAWLWGLCPAPDAVEVSLAGRTLRPRPRLVVHTVARIEATRRDGLPVTPPLRTLHDLRRAPDAGRLAAEAQVLRLVRPGELGPGADAPTRSALERALLRIVAGAGLPAPLVNHRVGAFECDFVWLPERVIVETDGWAAHGHRAAFEADRARDARLAAAGWTVMRLTWRQVNGDPLRVAARLARALMARGAAVPG